MPRERIFGSAFAPEGEEAIIPIAEVMWNREAGHVQLVTRELSHEIPSPEEQEKDGPWPCTYGFFVDLDRKGINDMIRVLRRARDQAFGRDE